MIVDIEERFRQYILVAYAGSVKEDSKQFHELRCCFFGAVYMMICLMKHDIPDMSDDDGMSVLQSIDTQCIEFAENEIARKHGARH